jgi:hypothetical protein
MIGFLSWHVLRETSQGIKPVRCRPHLIRGQAWDRKQSVFGSRWQWVVVHPADWRERWARAHPAEAEAAAARRRER